MWLCMLYSQSMYIIMLCWHLSIMHIMYNAGNYACNYNYACNLCYYACNYACCYCDLDSSSRAVGNAQLVCIPLSSRATR